MQEPSNELILFIVLTVLLFMALGICMVVLMDHKARIPGGFVSNPFSIIGIHRDHPVISFLTTIILFAIIASLIFEISVTIAEEFGLLKEEKESELLLQLHEQRFTERMRHFHNVPEVNLVELGKKQACFYCHGDYPHSKKRMIRTLLNMHTQFIGCMTCHTDEKKIPETTYSLSWLNYSGIEVTGPPFGTSINEKTGLLVKTDDYYSKIVVYGGEGDENRLLELTEDNTEVQEFTKLVAEGKLSDKDREGLKRRFHMLVNGKGRKCSHCHTEEEKSYIPFRALGFSDQRISDLSNLNIVGVVEKYVEFHMPDLMKNDTQIPGEQQQKNDTDKLVSIDEDVNEINVPEKSSSE